MPERLRAIGAALVWLLVVVAIALGGAGLVTAAPGGVLPAARPELTGVEDARATVRLDAVEADLEALGAKVETLGTQGRGALSALVGGQIATAETAIETGDGLLLEIGLEAGRIADALAATPYVGTPAADLHVSPEVQARYARLRDGLDATRQLDASWSRLTAGALSATRLSTSLAEHDRLVGEAAGLGRQGQYKDALVKLTAAADELTAAREMRTVLANTVDVTVLDQWLERNAAYDRALRALYVALARAGGKITDDVRDERAAEQEARRRLPPDSRALIVIIAEIGRGGMNGAVIAIEEAKARIADAIDPAAAP
jgi:hypothetical protein